MSMCGVLRPSWEVTESSRDLGREDLQPDSPLPLRTSRCHSMRVSGGVPPLDMVLLFQVAPPTSRPNCKGGKTEKPAYRHTRGNRPHDRGCCSRTDPLRCSGSSDSSSHS